MIINSVIKIFLIITFCTEWCIAGNLSPFENFVLFNPSYIVLTPSRLYKCTKGLNKLGCWIIFVLFRIINPVGTIGKVIHFIFTAGSEE